MRLGEKGQGGQATEASELDREAAGVREKVTSKGKVEPLGVRVSAVF